jgi:hypothetical protein
LSHVPILQILSCCLNQGSQDQNCPTSYHLLFDQICTQCSISWAKMTVFHECWL